MIDKNNQLADVLNDRKTIRLTTEETARYYINRLVVFIVFDYQNI